MQASKAADEPSNTERARLRAAGLSEDEITRILVARAGGMPPAGAAAVPQAPVSGVMGNFSAIWAHARNIIPTMAAQIMTVFNTSAATPARIAALLSVMVKAAFVCVFAYVVSLEFSQLKSSTDSARAAACNARMTQLVNSLPHGALSSQDPEMVKVRERYYQHQKQLKQDCQ